MVSMIWNSLTMYHLFTAHLSFGQHFMVQRPLLSARSERREHRLNSTNISENSSNLSIFLQDLSIFISYNGELYIYSRSNHPRPSQDSSSSQPVIVCDTMSAPVMTGAFCCRHQSTTGQTLPTMLTLNHAPFSANSYLYVSGVIHKINHNLVQINAEAHRSQTCLSQTSTVCSALRCWASQETPLCQNMRIHKSFLNNKLVQMQNIID